MRCRCGWAVVVVRLDTGRSVTYRTVPYRISWSHATTHNPTDEYLLFFSIFDPRLFVFRLDPGCHSRELDSQPSVLRPLIFVHDHSKTAQFWILEHHTGTGTANWDGKLKTGTAIPVAIEKNHHVPCPPPLLHPSSVPVVWVWGVQSSSSSSFCRGNLYLFTAFFSRRYSYIYYRYPHLVWVALIVRSMERTTRVQFLTGLVFSMAKLQYHGLAFRC